MGEEGAPRGGAARAGERPAPGLPVCRACVNEPSSAEREGGKAGEQCDGSAVCVWREGARIAVPRCPELQSFWKEGAARQNFVML